MKTSLKDIAETLKLSKQQSLGYFLVRGMKKVLVLLHKKKSFNAPNS